MLLARKITVGFESARHRILHDVLHSFGFSCEVIMPEMRIGRVYRLRHKTLEVELAPGADDELQAVTKDLTKPQGEQINTEDSFTQLEQEWLEQIDDEAEYLRRELYILIQIRPMSMIRPPAKELD